MQNAKIIKIFLASSEELENDRNAFGNFVRRLDDIYEKQGTRIKLFEWEDYDAAYNDKRKQDEYNEEVRISDLFLALFYKKAGKFTIEEYNVATEGFRHTGIKPKTYVYCRDLPEGEEETKELHDFKKHLSEDLGYYWVRYNNKDSMQLHFVMQLQIHENNLINDLKVENGDVMFRGAVVAHMDNLHFVNANKDYQVMNNRLIELPVLIEKARLRANKYSDDKDLQNELQKLLDEQNQLTQSLEKQQQFLMKTAIRIAQLQHDQITNRMKRAIDSFENGNVQAAVIILAEAEHDADRNATDYQQSKLITEQIRNNVICSIKEVLLKASILMADGSKPVVNRIEHTSLLYKKAIKMAEDIDYNKGKYSNILFDYAVFLYDYGFYKESAAIYQHQISLVEDLFGTNSLITALSYNNIGKVFRELYDYKQALDYFFLALEIREKELPQGHPDIATIYNNIGVAYWKQGNDDEAVSYFSKALTMREEIYNNNHEDIAISYNNIATIHYDHKDYEKSLEFYFKALKIKEAILEADNPSIATTYNNIGMAYLYLNKYSEAKTYLFKSLAIKEEKLGIRHPSTAFSYHNIGIFYYKTNKYVSAQEYLNKALDIYHDKYDSTNPNIKKAECWLKKTKYALMKHYCDKDNGHGSTSTQ